MFSGVGGEVLYQPFSLVWPMGLVQLGRVSEHMTKALILLGIKATTAFASVYWASPFYNFDVAVHAGKYLAKDSGATLESQANL